MDIIRKMKYVCQGIDMLLKHGFVHQDIKLENLVYNGNKLFLIDFGLMSRTSDVYLDKSFLKFDYMAFPPEYKRKYYGVEFERLFWKNFQDQPTVNFLKKIYPDFKQDLIELRLRPSYPCDKIDLYSLGIVILILYKWYGKRDEKIETLIRGMINFNPKKRWNINEVISYFVLNF
jgi:serine/threonine protein kinase